MPGQKLSQALFRHVCGTAYEDLPSGAVLAQKRSLADMLGVMLAATGLDAASAPFAAFAAAQGAGRCTVLGQRSIGPCAGL